MPRRLLLLALLAACDPPPTTAPLQTGPPPSPSILDLEVQRESATPALIERARRGPESFRAIRALGRVGDAAAISELRLQLTNPATRPAAADALATSKLLGADVADAEAAILTQWFDTPEHDRDSLVSALGRLGSAAAIATLAQVLRDGVADESAAIALGLLGRRGVAFDDQARAALVARADHYDPLVQYAVAYALAHEPEPANQREAGDAALVRLTRARDPETRTIAFTGLTRRKVDREQTSRLFTAGLDDRDFRVRTAAARGLLALGDETSHLRLILWSSKHLTDPVAVHPILTTLDAIIDLPEETVRSLELPIKALAAAATRTPATEPRIACQVRTLLARITRSTPSCPELPPHLAVAITSKTLPDPQLVPLLRDPDPRIRTTAISALLAHHSASTFLLELVADPSPAVVGTVADALAGKQPPPVTDALRTALAARAQHELSHEVELYAALVAALAAIKGPLEPCSAGLDHPNLAVRTAARACVTALTGADPGPQLPSAPPPRPPHPPSEGPRLHWRLTTTRGVVDVALDPPSAPWHVAALAAHTRAGFYDGLTFHRVVPGFVVQGGDPEGTGWGGPGYTLPSEPTSARFTRGAVGIADAGKDTGGCQFFFMHARAPHLEGRFTRVGEVTKGQDIVDTLLVGDVILRAEILP